MSGFPQRKTSWQDWAMLALLLSGFVIVGALIVALAIGGCATAPTYRTATVEEVAKYGVKPEARRYEYPDATVFIGSETTLHPDVIWDGRPISVSSDTKNTHTDNVVRSVETSMSCVPDTDKCSVTVQSTVLIMRPKSVKVATIPDSEVVTSVQAMGDWKVVMLRPTETSLRALVLRAVQLRDNPPRPGNDCRPTSLAADFIGDVHRPLEHRAAALLAQDGYVSIQSVMEAENTLVDYEMAKRGCLAVCEATEASIEGGHLIAQILGSIYVAPNL